MNEITYDELEEMVSYRRNVTGVSHTLFISPKGKTRHAPRIKIATDCRTIDPRRKVATIAIADGSVVAGKIDPRLLAQVRAFIAINRDVLEAYWNYKIDTDQLRKRLKRVP